MPWFYRNWVRPWLFSQNAETVHDATLEWLARTGRSEVLQDLISTFFQPEDLAAQAFGLNFPNPIGVAAGLDKNGIALPMWPALGFGFCEIGGVTREAQEGHPRPRVFRVPDDEAIINHMGLNNQGAQAVARRLAQLDRPRWRSRFPIGINIAKGAATPLSQAPADYAATLDGLWIHGDFFVVNVSSPNTARLRELQAREPLKEVLDAMIEVNRRRARITLPKPILVKIAPDLEFRAIDALLEVVIDRGIAGIVATNTTTSRPVSIPSRFSAVYQNPGGLSGKPLAGRSIEIVRYLYKHTQGKLPIIGVGGISSAQSAWERINAGACLVELYTALVYEGPGLLRQMVTGLAAQLQAHRLPRIALAVGQALPFVEAS